MAFLRINHPRLQRRLRELCTSLSDEQRDAVNTFHFRVRVFHDGDSLCLGICLCLCKLPAVQSTPTPTALSSMVGDVKPLHDAQQITLQMLPVELLADILSELDLDSLITVSCLSRRLRAAADTYLNPWRRPILRSLHRCVYEKSLFHLSIRAIVPRQNWIEILTFASASFLLFDSTLPNLRSSDWEECFRRRFLPGWTKWKKENSWREAFMKVLYRVWHRGHSSCTSDESWIKYIVINRNGSVNELEAASRSFNPLAIFHEMKLQSNLAHLPTQIRVVLQLMDIRVLAFGVMNHPRTHFTINRNAHAFLFPPGLGPPATSVDFGDSLTNHSNALDSRASVSKSCDAYRRLSHPTPSHTHTNYPMHTPGGSDQRWHPDAILGKGMQWVGGLMYIKHLQNFSFADSFRRVTVQLHPSKSHSPPAHGLQGAELFDGINHAQFASFTWRDFLAIAPWMEESVTMCIYGQGLGIH